GKAKGKPRAAAGKARPGASTAPRHLEERLAEALAQQTATGEILRGISNSARAGEMLRVAPTSPGDVHPVFDAIVKSAERLCDAELSLVARFDDGQLHLVAVNHVLPEEAEEYRRLFPRPPGRGFAMGRAIVDGRAVHIADVLADPDYDRQTQGALLRAAGYRTFLAVPILR